MELLFLSITGLIMIIVLVTIIIINREKIIRKFFKCDTLGHRFIRDGWDSIVIAGVTRRDYICKYCGEETSLTSDFPGNF